MSGLASNPTIQKAFSDSDLRKPIEKPAVVVERQTRVFTADRAGVREGFPKLKGPVGRRGLFELAIGGALTATLAGCGTGDAIPAVAKAGGAVAEAAEKISLIADALGGVVAGIKGVDVSKAAGAVQELAGIAASVSGAVSAVATHPLVTKAGDLIERIAGLLPAGGSYATILAAAVSLYPKVASLVGMATKAIRGARTIMSPEQAEAILRTAARRI